MAATISGRNYFNGSAPQPGAMPVIAPSILSADFAELGREIARCRRAKATWIHVDVMDGHFVPNLTFGPAVVRACRKAEPDLLFDTHLMIENPLSYAEAFHEAGSDVVTVHIETLKNPARDIGRLARIGCKVGISIKPQTPLREITDLLPRVDLVLVMTVEPGFGGQALIPSSLNKVRELDLLRRENKYRYYLQVDGGINEHTAATAVAAGADVLVAGSAVFGGPRSVAENLNLIRGEILRATPRPRPPVGARAAAGTRAAAAKRKS